MHIIIVYGVEGSISKLGDRDTWSLGDFSKKMAFF